LGQLTAAYAEFKEKIKIKSLYLSVDVLSNTVLTGDTVNK